MGPATLPVAVTRFRSMLCSLTRRRTAGVMISFFPAGVVAGATGGAVTAAPSDATGASAEPASKGTDQWLAHAISTSKCSISQMWLAGHTCGRLSNVIGEIGIVFHLNVTKRRPSLRHLAHFVVQLNHFAGKSAGAWAPTALG